VGVVECKIRDFGVAGSGGEYPGSVVERPVARRQVARSCGHFSFCGA
jgi:hypothetical protein